MNIDTIQIIHDDYHFNDRVVCPKVNEERGIPMCVKCDHCRMIIGTTVKCTYQRDMWRDSRIAQHTID